MQASSLQLGFTYRCGDLTSDGVAGDVRPGLDSGGASKCASRENAS